jgi:hypothetical protein
MPYSSYKTLLEKADLSAEDPLRVLFDRLETVDFERVVGALESASLVEAAYGPEGPSFISRTVVRRRLDRLRS